jgi:hypothetical protein
MVINLPTRQDLEPTSCVNQETKAFNRKLDKYMKGFNHISVVEMKWDREHHTRQGLHLNKKGKDLLMNGLVTDIKGLFVKTQRTPIIMSLTNGREADPIRKQQKEMLLVRLYGARI